MERFYNSDYLDIKSQNSSDYLRYLVTAPQEYARNLLMPITLIIYEMIVAFWIVLALLIFFPMVLLLIIIAIVPLSIILVSAVKKRLSAISEIKGQMEIAAYRHTFEGVQGYTDIKLFSKENVFIDLIQEKFRVLFKVSTETNLYEWFPRRIIETLVIVTVCILFLFTSILWNMNTSGLVLILVCFATASYRLMPSVNDILMNIVRIRTSRYYLTQLSYLEGESLSKNLPHLKFNKILKLDQVDFTYPATKQPVLLNLNLIIKKGDFVVITGESGCGKTTLGKILTGFVRQTSGKYLVDETEVQSLRQIKELIGYVTQDFYLFDKTLLENIAIGEEIDEVDLDRVKSVIHASNLSEFVDSLPLGIHYTIGEMGARLSGGQKQRIAIARALYKQPQILVLDEITSSLDHENEVDILETIYSIAKEKSLTVVLITHRVSSVKYYDSLYRLENDRLKKIEI